MLVAYSLGLGIPFLFVGLFSAEATGLIRKLGPFLKYFNIAIGILLIIMGIMVFTQTLSMVADFSFLNNLLLN